MSNKKLIILNTIWLLVIIAILFVAIVQLNGKNRVLQSGIKCLEKKLENTTNELNRKNSQLERVEFIRYQDFVVRKKYPLFSKIVETVYKKSKEYDFDPNLIMGMIQIESNFKPNAVSNKGAYGLMQINYSVWKNELDIDEKKIFDIEYNIDLGLRVLKRYFNITKGDILKTLHLYNNGFLYQNHKYKYQVTSTVFY